MTTPVPDPHSAPAPDAAESLLGMRVSRLIERCPAALELLVDAGFTPLANPALRAALAPTVTLAQALRLHPLPPEREGELLQRLEEARACRS